jgi:spindle assembly abnormal protein 6
VGESDFADLRKDQALLVDFSAFSDALISLLQCCELGDSQSQSIEEEPHFQAQTAFTSSQNAPDDTYHTYYGQPNHGPSLQSGNFTTPWNTPSQGQHHQMNSQQRQAMQYQQSPSPFGKMNSVMHVSTYTCRLEADYQPSSHDDRLQRRSDQYSVATNARNNSSQNARFSIVESNQFRELTHLALNLKTGTDKSVRLYLSSRLAQTMLQIGNIQSSYQEQQRRCEAAETNLIDLNKRLQELSLSSDAEKRHIQYQAEERLRAENNSRMTEVNELRASKEAEIHELNEQAQRSRALLENKVRVLEDINKRINEEKSTCANENERLATKLSIQEASSQSMTNELSTLKSQLQTLSDEKATTEKSLHQLQLQLASLEYSNTSHEKTITQSEAERESAEKVSANAKEALSRQHVQVEDLRRRLSEAELESSKLKDLTNRYQTNRLEMKKRIKEKVELLREQEQALSSKEREVAELKRSVQGLGDQLDESKRKMENLEKMVKGKDETLASKDNEITELKRRLDNNQQVIAWLNKQTSGGAGLPPSMSTPMVNSNPSSSSSLSRYLNGFQQITPDPSLPQQPHPLPSKSPFRPPASRATKM